MNADKKDSVIITLVGVLPVTWLALKIAPHTDKPLIEILANFDKVLADPFKLQANENSFKTILILNICYAMGIFIYLSMQKNYRRGEEHGSARWGNAFKVNKKYASKLPEDNKLLTQNVRLGLDGNRHRRNLNVLVIGGSGAGKTRFYCKPNLMQANTSYVVLDPKGEQVRAVGNLLREKGYEVKVLDLIDMEKSHCYNPFVYLRNDNDVQRLL